MRWGWCPSPSPVTGTPTATICAQRPVSIRILCIPAGKRCGWWPASGAACGCPSPYRKTRPPATCLVRVRLFRADTLSGQSEEELAEVVFRLHVLPASLPPQILTNSGWFHVDCLATWYRVPVFSEEHWAILGSYMRNAAAFGINLLLTPVFTPPLDTQVGGERPTAQLVDVYVQETGYRFGFDKLDRYMALAEDCGISQFEISHLFTQWGAGHAPKIMGLRDGREERLFGRETDAASPAYEAFLRAFLRALRAIWMKPAAWPLLFPSVR